MLVAVQNERDPVLVEELAQHTEADQRLERLSLLAR